MNHILSEFHCDFELTQKWRPVVDFRNVISHDYFGLNEDIIFKIIKEDIPILERDHLTFVKKSADIDTFHEVVEDAIQDLQRMRREQSIENLQSLLQKI